MAEPGTSGIFALTAEDADAICVFFLDHRNIASIRYSVRRLRRKFPSISIGICPWGAPELNAISESAGADKTVGSLRDALGFCLDPRQGREDLSQVNAPRRDREPNEGRQAG
jgi:hypothetical protein